MRTATWYFDFISPFAYLQWQRVRALPLELEPRPILFAALLDHWGQKGPAEIPAKRTFTYQFVQWRARRAGVRLRFPPAHPFNPLAALRLCLACGASRASVGAIFDWIWGEGRLLDGADAIDALGARLGVDDAPAAIARPDVKLALRTNTERAIADNVFGVPTTLIDGHAFWGDDATPMLEDYLAHPELFEDDEMRRIAQLPQAASRIG